MSQLIKKKYSQTHFHKGEYTKAVRGGYIPGEQLDQSVPLHITSAYHYESAERIDEIYGVYKDLVPGNDYGRSFNPTTKLLEKKIALLENTDDAIACSSGIQAIFISITNFCSNGDHLVCSRDLYGISIRLLEDTLVRFGISYTLVDSKNLEEWENATQENTKLYFCETPSNPTLTLTDIKKVSALAKKRNILTVVDSTFATPIITKPTDLGADIVVHSGTKFLDGQGRTVSGIVCGSQKLIDDIRGGVFRTVGGCISPFNAWVLVKALELLPLRIEKQSDNSLKLAQFLEKHPKIESVLYPFLESHPQYSVAKSQQKHGGAVISFYLKGGLKESQTFVNNLSIITLMGNLGDIASIITIPSRTSHSRISQEQRDIAKVSDNLIRFSVGIENVEDLIADLENALSKI